MTKNPFYNALCAILYIATLVTSVFYGSNLFEGILEESIFLPMGFLAIFVLSAALMGYLFLYEPIIMILDGERQEGVKLFLQTVGVFAVATALLIIIALSVGTLGGPGIFID